MHFMHYNYIRPHSTLTAAMHGKPTTPAMAAGLTEHPLTYLDLVDLIDTDEETAADVALRRKDLRR